MEIAVELFLSTRFLVPLFACFVVGVGIRIFSDSDRTSAVIGAAFVLIPTLVVMGLGDANGAVIVAVAVAGVAGWMWDVDRQRVSIGLVLVSGGVLSFWSGVMPRLGFQLAIVVFIPIVAIAIVDFDRRIGGWGVVFAFVTVLGVFGTVPSTRDVVALMGAFTIYLGWLTPRFRFVMPASMWFAFTVFLVWLVASGGEGRTGSIVGGMAAFAIMLIEPVARFAGRRLPVLAPRPMAELGVRAMLATHLFVAVTMSRVAGFRETSEPALALVVGISLVGGAFEALPRHRSPEEPAVESG